MSKPKFLYYDDCIINIDDIASIIFDNTDGRLVVFIYQKSDPKRPIHLYVKSEEQGQELVRSIGESLRSIDLCPF